jgi:hypothetical protein
MGLKWDTPGFLHTGLSYMGARRAFFTPGFLTWGAHRAFFRRTHRAFFPGALDAPATRRSADGAQRGRSAAGAGRALLAAEPASHLPTAQSCKTELVQDDHSAIIDALDAKKTRFLVPRARVCVGVCVRACVWACVHVRACVCPSAMFRS